MSAFSLPFSSPAVAQQAPAAPMAVPMGVESMFSQILEAVQKSVCATKLDRAEGTYANEQLRALKYRN